MDHSAPIRPQRKRLRWSKHDYSATATYFVTICVHDKECLLGEVVDGRVRRTPYGDVADACWRAIPDHFRHVTLDLWVTMPNHVHGILTVRAEPAATSNKRRQPLPPISIVVRSFKSAATKQINELRSSPGAPVWQRSFHEHVVRTMLIWLE
jgi:REP element-mobilizing transposase RayT